MSGVSDRRNVGWDFSIRGYNASWSRLFIFVGFGRVEDYLGARNILSIDAFGYWDGGNRDRGSFSFGLLA